jgi:ornithine decarboxylase
MYGSLSELATGGIELPARLIRLKGKASNKMQAFTLNGPTCDSMDLMPGTFDLPEDACEGDWIEIDRVGAYSNANATRFNGFFPETFVEVFDEPPFAQAPAKKAPRRRTSKRLAAPDGTGTEKTRAAAG